MKATWNPGVLAERTYRRERSYKCMHLSGALVRTLSQEQKIPQIPDWAGMNGLQRAQIGHTSPLQNLTLVSLQKDQLQICGDLCQKAPVKQDRAHWKKPVVSLRGRVWKSWELYKYFWTQDLNKAGGDPALPCQTKQVFPAALLPHHILPNFPEGSGSLYSFNSAKAAPNNLLLSSYASNDSLWHYWCKPGKRVKCSLWSFWLSIWQKICQVFQWQVLKSAIRTNTG